MNIIEQALVVAARRIGSSILGPGPHALPAHARERIFWGCQRFLEAHAPEYADVRAWRDRVPTPPIEPGWKPGIPERCPRCEEVDCPPWCIAAEQTEIDKDTGPRPRKYA